MSELLTRKELAVEMKRGMTYITALKAAMHAAGYPWPGGRIRQGDAEAWLMDNPGFSSQHWHRRIGGKSASKEATQTHSAQRL